jgi:hypothetical protein
MDDISIFEQLKQIRIDAGIELASIASQSKIQLRFLEALEEGKLELIPPVYDQMFFQTYISYLKPENEEYFVSAFNEIRKKRKTQHTSTIQRKVLFEKESRRAKNLKILYISFPIAIVAALILFLIGNSIFVEPAADNGVKEINVKEIADTLRKAAAKEFEKEKRPDSVLVKLHALERTWFRVITDNSDTSEYMLPKGRMMEITADSAMSFLVGNAAGIDFNINNRQEGVLGSAEEVIAYLKVTSEGIAAKRLKKISKRKETSD